MPGFVPAAEPLYVPTKVAKTIDAHPGLIRVGGRKLYVRADQLAALRQGPPVIESVRPWDRTAGVGYGKIFRRTMNVVCLVSWSF